MALAVFRPSAVALTTAVLQEDHAARPRLPDRRSSGVDGGLVRPEDDLGSVRERQGSAGEVGDDRVIPQQLVERRPVGCLVVEHGPHPAA